MFLDRLESIVEGIFDGIFRVLLGGKLQPLEIARLLTRHAEDEKIISLNRIYVPNRFIVGVHPQDFASIGAVSPELEAELQRFVGEWVAERNYCISGPVRVQLTAKEGIGRGRVRIQSRVDEMEEPEQDDAPTGIYRGPLPQEAVGRLEGIEGPSTGKAFPLYPKRTIVGRAVDCDITLTDRLLSRYHAALEPVEDGWRLEDLDSTNGCVVNNQTGLTFTLKDGDLVRLGENTFRFRAEESLPAEEPDDEADDEIPSVFKFQRAA
jgi:hypothetical protein